MDAVIVTHNSADDLCTMVASQATVESFDRLLVVDNASTDDTREVAADAGLEVVSLEANRGLAAAANVGVDRASGPSFALLNPDVRATSAGDFRRLEEELAEDGIGAVAPALVLPDGTLQDSARWVPTPLDLVVRRISGNDRGAVRVTNPVDVEWATAACLVIRRCAFDQIGGFDERYFLYFEDVDLCVRLRTAGFRVRYDPTVRLHHDYRAASRASIRTPETRHHMRSALRFFQRTPAALLPRRRRLADLNGRRP
ncbi:MAG TPA: glycosyltransferase family 2 protein [Solirubrobacterales bacterium]